MLAVAQSKVGTAQLLAGKIKEANESYQSAVEILRRVHKEDPKDARVKLSLSYYLYYLATSYFMLDDQKKASALFEECLTIRRDLAKADPRSSSRLIELMLTLARCGKHTEAVAIAERLHRVFGKNAGKLVQIASGYGLAAWGLATPDKVQKLTEEQKKLREQYLSKGLKAVQAAVKYGFNSVSALKVDPDPAPLRKLPEMNKLIADLEKKAQLSKSR